MIGLPDRAEAAEYYFTYIDKVSRADIVPALEDQLKETVALLQGISEDKSLYRYAPEKWSIRESLNHVTDTERAFAFRALWFARGFDSPLPSYDQNTSAAGACANDYPWASHIEDFRAVRQASMTLYRNMPADAWLRYGIASGVRFSVRALAYIIAGHTAHHLAILRERYLAG